MGKYADMLLGGSETPVQGGKWSSMILGQPATGGQTGQPIPGPADPQTPPGTLTSKDLVRDMDAAAGVGDVTMASFADDPNVQIGYFAAKRFPDLPIKEAVKRYQAVDGEIAYQGDDGRFYAESPGALRWVASGASKAIPTVSGLATAVATAPMWLSGPPGAALSTELSALAAGAGEGVRQAIGKEALGDPTSMSEVGKEMAFSVAGDVVGGLATRGMARGAARDISRMDADDVQALQNLSSKYGIDLTPAELTNLPSLKAKQKALGNLPESGDDMQDFYIRRAGQVDNAIGKELTNISPVDSVEQAGMMTRDAAGKAVKAARKARSDAAKPLYEFVNDPNTLIPDADFAILKGDKFLSGEIKKVKGRDLYGMESYPDNSLPVLDQVKKNLDDQIESASRAGNRNEARLLKQRRDRLLDVTDKVYPDYPVARSAFAGDSPAVDDLEKGVVGVIAKLEDPKAKDAASKLFNPSTSGPRQVSIAKNSIGKTDPDAWQAIKRAYLEDMWQKASKESMSNQGLNRGGKFRAMLFGDKKQDVMLRTMLEPAEYANLLDLSRVLEASGRVKQVGSDTAWNQELMRIERDQARPGLAKAAAFVRVTNWPKAIEEWSTERSLKNNARQMAHIITSPDAINNLKELRRLPPSSARAAVLTAYVLGIGSRAAAAVPDDESDLQDQR